MEFSQGDRVWATLPDDQGNEVRRAKFVEICDPDDAVIYNDQLADAAWVEWLDDDDAGHPDRVPRGPLRPA